MIHYPGIVIHPLCSALCPHYPGDHFCHSINFKFSPFTFTILSMRLRVLLYHYLLQTSFEVIVFHEKHLGALGLKNSRQFPLFQGVGSSEMHLNLNGTQSSCGLFSFNKWRIVGIVWGRKLKTTLCYIRGRETLCNTINWGVGPGPDLAGPSVQCVGPPSSPLSLGYWRVHQWFIHASNHITKHW